MSEVTATPRDSRLARRPARNVLTRALPRGLLVLALAIAPLYLQQGPLVVGLGIMAAAVGAIGLTILFGATGQLSLAHAFFIAVGTYGYAFLAGEAGGLATPYGGLGWPPLLAAVAAIALAGALGYAFSPISARVSGLYLGIASLALVVLGQHLLNNWQHVTGGSNGRAVTPFEIGALRFAQPGPDDARLQLLGVPLGRNELLWYLFVPIFLTALLLATRQLAGRTGRAFRMIRDNVTVASVLGVNVKAYKARSFAISSMYAGTAGVMLALVLGNPVPTNFGLVLSISYLAMVVIGGLGTVTGSVLGAAFVIGMPYLLTTYAGSLPLVAPPGSGGIDPGVLTKIVYGATLAAVLLLMPEGLVGIARAIRSRLPLAKH